MVSIRDIDFIIGNIFRISCNESADSDKLQVAARQLAMQQHFDMLNALVLPTLFQFVHHTDNSFLGNNGNLYLRTISTPVV